MTVGSFVCVSLLFASCLLTSPFSHVYSGRGGYHSVKQYPHASLGVLLSSASSSCAFWEGDMNDFQKSTRRWQSCKRRLKPGPLTQVRFPRYKWLFSEKTIKKIKHDMIFESSESYIPNFISFVQCRSISFCLIALFMIRFYVLLNCSDHASEVQVTMMLTESCKLRGLHHRWVKENERHFFPPKSGIFLYS